ncbi:hypothetical protein [Eubacterium aggregans]|uniref:hypothetical protein n=1 Tax=Eubacterium aggregans TaxID=81409 RepID=UPI003F38CBAF
MLNSNGTEMKKCYEKAQQEIEEEKSCDYIVFTQNKQVYRMKIGDLSNLAPVVKEKKTKIQDYGEFEFAYVRFFWAKDKTFMETVAKKHIALYLRANLLS